MCARIDEAQIDKNRRIVANSTLESPWNSAIEDCDADYAEQLFVPLPKDKVGLLPPTEWED